VVVNETQTVSFSSGRHRWPDGRRRRHRARADDAQPGDAAAGVSTSG